MTVKINTLTTEETHFKISPDERRALSFTIFYTSGRMNTVEKFHGRVYDERGVGGIIWF